jgi:hypothetical protein
MIRIKHLVISFLAIILAVAGVYAIEVTPRELMSYLNEEENLGARVGSTMIWQSETLITPVATTVDLAVGGTTIANSDLYVDVSANKVYFNNVEAGTVSSVAMTVPTSLSISGSPITTSGTLALSLTSGYVIPLSASTTEWATAYGWGNHALAGYLTTSSNFTDLADTPANYTGSANKCVAVNGAGNALEFIVCGGGGSSGAGIFATSTTDNLLAYVLDGADSEPYRMLIGGTATTSDVYFELTASSTDGYIAVGTTGGDVLILDENGYLGLNDTTPSYRLDVNGTFRAVGASYLNSTLSVGGASSFTGNITSLGTLTGYAITATSTLISEGTLSVSGTSAFTGNITSLGTLTGKDIVATSSLDIPSGASPTVDAEGEIAIDTTSDQFVYYGGAKRVLSYLITPSITIASTTWNGMAGGTATSSIPVGVAGVAETWLSYQCFTDTGTIIVQFGDGSNEMTSATASTTVGTITTSSNNTFTAGEKRYMQVSNAASTPNFVSCTIKKTYSAD